MVILEVICGLIVLSKFNKNQKLNYENTNFQV